MELLTRYVNAIGNHLPRKNRSDIEAEIRSTLEDMLEDRSQKADRPVDEAMVKELLKEYGAPEKVAATYQGKRYLIGPQMFPYFLLVLKIVFLVLTILALVGMGIGIGTGPMTVDAITQTIVHSMIDYLAGAMSAFGNIVFVFAILELFLPAKSFEEKGEEKEWDPTSLMKEPEADEVRIWDPILAILFNFIALVIFNFYPQVIGFTPSLNQVSNGSWVFIPILSQAAFQYVPWFNIVWIAEIGLHLVLLRQSRWNKLTRWFSIAIRTMGIGIACALLVGPALLTIAPETVATLKMEPGAAESLINLLNQMLRIGLVAIISVSLVSLIKDLYRLIFRSPKVIK